MSWDAPTIAENAVPWTPHSPEGPAAAIAAALTLAASIGGSRANAPVNDEPQFGSLAPAITLVRSGPAEVIYNWKKQRCGAGTAPDSPARAFRGPDGNIRLIAASADNWSMLGPKFDHLQVDCHSLWQGSGKAGPGDYDDRSRIEATYALPGGVIVALASNEWNAVRHRERAGEIAINCADPRNDACVLYSITQLVSHDAGVAFHYGDGAHLAAALPYRFDPQQQQAGGVGVASVSNIISRDGYYYVYLGVRGIRDQKSGSCLMRTSDLLRPESWRAWDGSDFSVEFADPYAEPPVDAAGHLCLPVAPEEVRSIQYIGRYDTYIGLFRGWGRSQQGGLIAGIFYATTPDLIRWSPWQLLMQIPADKDCREVIQHPSMLSDDDPTANFEGDAAAPYLYYVRVNRTACRATIDRDLLRVRLEIHPSVNHGKGKPRERTLNAGGGNVTAHPGENSGSSAAGS